MTNIAMMQPAFMPWLGFFELALNSDRFVILDDFQYSVQSYHQRNRLFINHSQVGWYSVPVLKSVSFKLPLNQTKIDESGNWRQKMWRRIQHNYSKAAYYKLVAPRLEEWLLTKAETLAHQNIAFIRFVCDLLGFKGEYVYSSSLKPRGERSERVVDLLRMCNAKRYFCARGAYDYMCEDGIFPLDDIEVCFQDFRPKPYEQVGSKETFVPYLSVVDALMNVGPADTCRHVVNGTERWLKWGCMHDAATADIEKEM